MNRFFKRSLLSSLAIVAFLTVPAQTDTSATVRPDSSSDHFIMVPADSMLKSTGLKDFLVGKNYRNEWTTPVKVPVIDLKDVPITSLKEGGGKETKSLHLEETTGKNYALRSVEKFPEKAIPAWLKKTASEKLITDGLSASYPYGVLSMGVLSEAARVPYLQNKLRYIPDDSVLNGDLAKYRNMLVLMEDSKDPIIFDIQPAEKKTISTEELVQKLRSGKNRVNQTAVLRARLLDNFVMDFDRHEEQWDWMGLDSAGHKFFSPVPKDRDQVFFVNQGILTKLVSHKTLLPELQGFRKKAKNINTFNHAALNFDHFFLTGLSQADWETQVDQFLRSMTDSVIESSLHKQPKEIRSYSADKIIETLKSKRDYFKSDMMKYYRFLARTVSIVGSDDPELFHLSKNKDGTLSVVVSKIDSNGNSSSLIYDRTFDPHDTKEIRIYGLEGDDSFRVDGSKSKIRIRLIGGPGKDHFINTGDKGKVIIYDLKEDNNVDSGRFRNKITGDPLVNIYPRLEIHQYNSASAGPGLQFGDDGGFFVGLAMKITTLGFRKDPYATKESVLISRAVNNVSYALKYSGEFIRLFGNSDLTVHADTRFPTARTLFFGIGNTTQFDKSVPGKEKYYLVHYNVVNVSALVRSPLSPSLHISYGPIFQSFKVNHPENEEKYLTKIYSPDSAGLYQTKSYGGVTFNLNIDRRNDSVMPSRGFQVNLYGQSLSGLNKPGNSFTETGASISLFTDFLSKKHVVFATSFGASHIFGKYEFEKAQYLGLLENLRGFRITRFAGRTRAYNNTELRINFGDINAILFRSPGGILVFNDVGRVWADGEKSNLWHDGYGAGLWLAPFEKIVVTGSFTFSKEQKGLPLLTIGFQF